MKEELIRQILEIEWPMFESVENEGGKASCQMRPKTFEIMRKSQYESWPEEVLASYLKDLEQAAIKKRNLCAEKYAFMMESTAPEEYQKIKSLLPEVSEEKRKKIREITDINLSWTEITDGKYPAIRGSGRALRSEEDTPCSVSVETYLYCELKTYSEETIDLLYQYTLQCREKGINLAERTLEFTMQEYGYASLEEAERTMEERLLKTEKER